MSGEIADCVEDRLDGTEVASSEAQAAVIACQSELVFAPQFAASLSAQHPGVYGDEQLACLQAGFASLSAADSAALLKAGLSSSLDESSVATGILDRLFADCGLAVPAYP